jgi:hypothetical protein
VVPFLFEARIAVSDGVKIQKKNTQIKLEQPFDNMGNCAIKRTTTVTTVHTFVSSVENIYLQWQKQELPIAAAKAAIEDVFLTIFPFVINDGNISCTPGSGVRQTPPQVFQVTTTDDILIVVCSLVVAVMNGGLKALHVGFTLTPHPSDNNVEASQRHKPLIMISTDETFNFKKDPTSRDASRIHSSFTPIEDLTFQSEGDNGDCPCHRRDCRRNNRRHH